MTKKALIAGWGELPHLWAERAQAAGEDFIILKIAEEITADFSDLAVEEYTVNLTQFAEIIKIIEANKVEEIIWLGKVQKAHLFDNFNPDQTLQQILAELPDFIQKIRGKCLNAGFNGEGLYELFIRGRKIT